MRQRSNLIILFGIAFFLVGGAIVYLVLDDEDDGRRASSSGEDEVSVLIAAEDIPANTLGADAIEQGLLTTDQMPTASAPTGHLTSASELDNRIFAVNVSEGDVITGTQTATRSLSNVPIPEGFEGLAVRVEYTPGGGGYIAPGDRVNVYGVYGGGGGSTDGGLAVGIDANGTLLPRTELALTNVLVLDVDKQEETSAQTAAEADGGADGRASQPLTYLLALKPTDVERVVQLTTFADVYLSLMADDAPNVADTPGSDGSTVNGPVSADSAAPQS